MYAYDVFSFVWVITAFHVVIPLSNAIEPQRSARSPSSITACAERSRLDVCPWTIKETGLTDSFKRNLTITFSNLDEISDDCTVEWYVDFAPQSPLKRKTTEILKSGLSLVFEILTNEIYDISLRVKLFENHEAIMCSVSYLPLQYMQLKLIWICFRTVRISWSNNPGRQKYLANCFSHGNTILSRKMYKTSFVIKHIPFGSTYNCTVQVINKDKLINSASHVVISSDSDVIEDIETETINSSHTMVSFTSSAVVRKLVYQIDCRTLGSGIGLISTKGNASPLILRNLKNGNHYSCSLFPVDNCGEHGHNRVFYFSINEGGKTSFKFSGASWMAIIVASPLLFVTALGTAVIILFRYKNFERQREFESLKSSIIKEISSSVSQSRYPAIASADSLYKIVNYQAGVTNAIFYVNSAYTNVKEETLPSSNLENNQFIMPDEGDVSVKVYSADLNVKKATGENKNVENYQDVMPYLATTGEHEYAALNGKAADNTRKAHRKRKGDHKKSVMPNVLKDT